MTTDKETQQFAAGVLECKVLASNELTPPNRDQMFRLMTDYYDNVERADFERDLAEKEWVIITSDSRRGIVGFTTLMLLRAACGDEQLVALFTGDTVLDPDVWGTSGWARSWGRLAAKISDAMAPTSLYALVLTATHRTYRFLPTFLKEYYPRPDVQTPDIFRKRIEALLRQKFPQEYDPSRGIVRTHRPMSVRQQHVARATQGMADAYAAFFAEANPGYLHGDYLACIADVSVYNRTRLGHRFFALDDV